VTFHFSAPGVALGTTLASKFGAFCVAFIDIVSGRDSLGSSFGSSFTGARYGMQYAVLGNYYSLL